MILYPLETKLRALELYKIKRSVNIVAQEMNIHAKTIRSWKSVFHNGSFIDFPFGKKDPAFKKLLKEFNLLKKDLKKARLEIRIFKKSREYLSKRTKEKYLFIVKYKSIFSVSHMCRVLKINEAAYYKWLERPIPQYITYRNMMMPEVKKVFYEHEGRYGSRRIAFELNERGFKISQVTVCNYMKLMDLRVNGYKRYIITTDSRHGFNIAENKLTPKFKVIRCNQVWVSDITYIRMGGYRDWMFLTVVIDLFDKKVIGWSLSQTMMTVDTTLNAFRMALINRPVNENLDLIFHSDRGVQYACKEFISELKKYPSIIQSMSRRGNMWDNAVAESFFSIIKNELINQNVYKTKEQAEASIYDYIENYYNKIRRHSALNNMTIDEFHEAIKNSFWSVFFMFFSGFVVLIFVPL